MSLLDARAGRSPGNFHPFRDLAYAGDTRGPTAFDEEVSALLKNWGIVYVSGQWDAFAPWQAAAEAAAHYHAAERKLARQRQEEEQVAATRARGFAVGWQPMYSTAELETEAGRLRVEAERLFASAKATSG